MSNIHQGIIQLSKKLNDTNANEAETRFQLIDKIILEVLGWTRDDISVEERVTEDGNNTYADYVLRTISTCLVIEAKRAGSFELKVPDVRHRRLNATFVAGDLKTPINQARDYARSKSIPFAVVTNGEAWIIYPASRVDGISFAKSTAIIFPNLESALADDFYEFKSLLGRESVVNGSLEEKLLGEKTDQIDERRLRLFFQNHSANHARNELYPLVEDAVELALTNSLVEDQPELLEKSYVRSAENKRFDNVIRMKLQRHKPLFKKKPTRPLQKKESHIVSAAIEAANTSRSLVLLVLGQVGSGKTTFIHFTRYITCKEMFRESKAEAYAQWIYIDFRAFSQSENVRDFIYKGLTNHIDSDIFLRNYEQCIRPAYTNEIHSLKEGALKPIKDGAVVDQKISEYLLSQMGSVADVNKRLSYAASKAPVFLVVDNIDQLSSGEQQSEIFSEAISIAHRNNLNLVIALRESTYVKHRSSSVFDAFDFTPIAIEPPQIRAVLSRRFSIMKDMLMGRSGEFTAENGAKMKVDDLSKFVDLISSSVLGTNIGRYIDVLATSDIRLALRMTREYLASGYSNPGRAMQVHLAGKKYVLPLHEALRALMLGTNPVYEEAKSVLGNPFDSYLHRTRFQMLRLFILSALVRKASDADFQYMDGPDIRRATRSLGFGDDEVLQVMQDLCRLRFIHTASHLKPDFESSFYPSILGGHIVRVLIADIAFLENVMMDTFISDKRVWDRLYELSDSVNSQRNFVEKLRVRVERVRIFVEHIKSMYGIVLDEAIKRNLPSEWRTDPFEERAKLLKRNMDQAVLSAERGYAKTKGHQKRKSRTH